MITFSSYKSGSQTIYQKHGIRDDGSVAYSRTARFPFIHYLKMILNISSPITIIWFLFPKHLII